MKQEPEREAAERIGAITGLARDTSVGAPILKMRDLDGAPDDRADARQACLRAYVLIVAYGREIARISPKDEPGIYGRRTAFAERALDQLRRYCEDLRWYLERSGVSRQDLQDAVEAL